ncbi:alpha/beta hydrolase [Algoriphagus confluentis]|uniref:Esterase n=1 Tax=Algoriphagus confluentis TaxID=1697556 RepID=A0ABQ6PLG9_9BACT|nr:esterase [Algoriphagus confluentis]
MEKKKLIFPHEAFYSISHQPTGKEQEIWLVFHGYGQLSEFFIRKFLPFSGEDRLILAPEGTNYGYLKDFQGRVGANWMTRYERETAIANNHRFLDLLMKEILQKYPQNPSIHLLGFSQGAATATRWAARWDHRVKQMIIWAGGFAHDLILEKAKDQFRTTEILMVFGEKDELITSESIASQRAFFGLLEKEVRELTFDGGHELNIPLLQKIIKKEG